MARVSRNVLLLALTSFLADVSGEMLMAVLPFLLVAQGAGGVGLGLVGGAADAVGHLVKPLAGRVADRTRKRKPLIVLGYLVAAFSRVGIALAPFWQLTLLFRGTDRVGKGLRSAPRDALLAESAPRERRGRAFGLHRSADTAGAFVGVALALVGLAWWGASEATFAAIVLVGGLVGLSTALPLAFVREVDPAPREPKAAFEPASGRYRAFLAVAALFALGQVSYLFFVLRAGQALGSARSAVALYLLFNAVYALGAYPAGRAADRWGKPPVLAVGFLAFALSAALLTFPPTPALAVASFVVLGISFALVDGVERALAADLSGTAARGTRLGIYHATVGLAALAGGAVAGVLWEFVGEYAAFAWGALVPVAATALLARVVAERAAPG